MTARRLKNGSGQARWYVDFVFRHPDGRKQRVREIAPVQTKVGAEEYERKLRQGMLNPAPVLKESPTLERFVRDQWWDTYPVAAKNRPATLREKRKHLDLRILPVLGRVPLSAIDRRKVDVFFASLAGKELSTKYCKNIGGTLHKILATAVEWDLLEKLPRFPKITVPDAEWDWFTAEETRALLAKARSPEEYALLLFPFDTGARAGEQLGLHWGDIDWHNRKVVFRRAISEGLLGPTKSGKTRHVPLTPALAEALKAIRHLRGKHVFCNDDGSPLSLWQLHERLEGACRRAGLRRIRWHDTRHSFASQLTSAGVPLRQVQEYLGHSSITMTMRYAHLAPNDGADMRRALDRSPANQGNSMATAPAKPTGTAAS
jgi:integrase